MGSNDSNNTLPSPKDIIVTETLDPKDKCNYSKRFQVAKKNEIEGLNKRGTWEVVNRPSLPRSANIIGGRFANALKNAGTENETAKARYVAQGFRDKMKPFVVHNTPTLRQSSTKVIVSCAVMLDFRICLLDITQAYLQSKDQLSRNVFISPKPQDLQFFCLGQNKVLRLKKPLYGICDSGDYWAATFEAHVRKDFKMTPTSGDPSLFIKTSNGLTAGLLGNYVDDCLFAGKAEFMKSIEQTRRKFESKAFKWNSFEFLGVNILNQTDYINRLQEMDSKCTFDKFRSVRAAISWACHSRPDICCATNRACQVVESKFCLRHIKDLNKVIRRVKDTSSLSLLYDKLDINTLHIRVYSDASFASNEDRSSQVGYIILLAHDTTKCHVIAYSSKKSKRVVKSIMAGEFFAFSEAFDHAFVLKHDLEYIYKRNVGVTMFTDSKQLFDVITTASHTTEKRLMVEISAARESYNKYEISNVGLIAGEDNPADGLIKPKICEPLDKLLKTSLDKTQVVQWIYRK